MEKFYASGSYQVPCTGMVIEDGRHTLRPNNFKAVLASVVVSKDGQMKLKDCPFRTGKSSGNYCSAASRELPATCRFYLQDTGGAWLVNGQEVKTVKLSVV